jgi:hypothetical protein
MSTDLMAQAIGLHFKLTSKLLPFPFSWDHKRKQLKYQNFMPRFIPWYCMTFVVLPVTNFVSVALLFYEIIQPQRTMNFFQLLFMIGIMVVTIASIQCAADSIRFSEEWVAYFNQIFPLRNNVTKGTNLQIILTARRLPPQLLIDPFGSYFK